MVGVPRSSSCRECLQRRVKCDRALPECRRCQVRGVRCPGYHRAFKFYNRTTDGDFTDARAFDSRQKSRETDLMLSRPSIDGSRVPNLARIALDIQAKEVFENVVMTTFPLTFLHFKPCLEPNWIDFIRHHQAAQTEPIEKAMRCVNLWYMGVKNRDPKTADLSRYAYGDALRCLARYVGNARTRTSDITLAAAIMIAVFEMLDPITPHSWLTHSRGIAGLIRERGARVHSSGFGRTMFVTIRSFLLADAFVRLEPSYLAEPEWRFVATVAKHRAGKGSWIEKIVELVFNEISLGPGLLSQTTALITEGSVDVSRDDLTSRIRTSRGILRNLQQQLVSATREKLEETGKKTASEPDHFRGVARHCLQGTCSGVALLDQLLVLLEADKKRESDCISGTEAWGAHPTPVPSGSTIEGPFSGDDRPLDWLDQISMSMGTLALSKNSRGRVSELGD
ncbi:Zn(II)2Cys6 transcription factor domain-containing protein [Aspergillus undulatus]|uniref:Zn(II)2Cys6 transcription factor domain-containing protein n=1 Tax=Aspergillus undulatus TaxID=1810928 RepID=UPI003CCD2DC3